MLFSFTTETLYARASAQALIFSAIRRGRQFGLLGVETGHGVCKDRHCLALKRRAPVEIAGQRHSEGFRPFEGGTCTSHSRRLPRRCLRLYHVERETPSASHGCFAGRLGPMPCARRHRSERKRAFSRRSASVIFAVLRVTSLPVSVLRPQRGQKVQHVAMRRAGA